MQEEQQSREMSEEEVVMQRLSNQIGVLMTQLVRAETRNEVLMAQLGKLEAEVSSKK